jgi:hypothetical protein
MATKFTYTETDVQELVQKYQAGVELSVLATEYSKSVASVRMKLVKLGVYQKATTNSNSTRSATVTKSGEFPKTKSGILAYYKNALGSVGPALL